MSDCTCDKCVSMCKFFPCLPTVHDVEKMRAAGIPDEMLRVYSHSGSVNHIRAARRPDGSCVFLENERCILHTAGLKPTEGKAVDHKTSMPGWFYSMVFREWKKKFPQDKLHADNFGVPL